MTPIPATVWVGAGALIPEVDRQPSKAAWIDRWRHPAASVVVVIRHADGRSEHTDARDWIERLHTLIGTTAEIYVDQAQDSG